MINIKRTENFTEFEEKRLLTMATEFLAKKKGSNYYEVEGIEYMEEGENIEHRYGVCLDTDEVKLLKSLLDNPEEEYTIEELQESIPFYGKLIADGYNYDVQPQKIDLDHPYHLYRFSVVTMDSPDSKTSVHAFRTHLTDAMYIELFLWRMKHRDYSFNQLVEEHPRLYCNLTYSIINSYSYGGLWGCGFHSPFVVFMDEIDNDVFDAVGEPDFNEQVYNTTVGERCQHTFLDIKERKLLFELEDVNAFNLSGVRKSLEKIDAIAVQKSLGVANYKEMHEKIVSLYGYGLAGFDDFKKFLDDNNIEYTYSETND